MINTDRGKAPFGEVGRRLTHEVVERLHLAPSAAALHPRPAATPKPVRSGGRPCPVSLPFPSIGPTACFPMRAELGNMGL